MKTNVTTGSLNPTATLAINKGRVKVYNKKSELPTYYLQKGQEFQIELFNTTTDKVLAKIKMNGKLISQSGLVLRPGERVFLDRYFDIDKKFKFDTYEVSGGDEVKQAIRDNGDIEILFYKEVHQYVNISTYGDTYGGSFGGPVHTTNTFFYGDMTSTGGYVHGSVTNTNTNTTITTTGSVGLGNSTPNASLDSLQAKPSLRRRVSPSEKKLKGVLRSTKIETGRVEQGAQSNQKFQTVDVNFETYPFHKISYKLLPISQKNVESQDLRKSYCTNCGAKAKAKDNFCSKCGRKV
tara:strand:+ start:30906 stop:31787 length:882 start_codon:yes stop_codon:yes gene_type:complete